MPTFWKPGSTKPDHFSASDVDRDTTIEDSGSLNFNRYSSLSIKEQRQRLPIFKKRTAILYCVESHATTIIVGQTGSGKTTQIPQYLVEAGWAAGGRLVGCTQPRRVAVQSVSARVADEMGCSLGQEVGYTIRFENLCTAGVTRVKYLTDGVLLREMMEDPLLTKYSVILVDEAHERSTATDILLGLLKKIQRRRPDLRLIISSATLAADAMAAFFDTSKERRGVKKEDEKDDPSRKPVIVSVEGRMYPVQMHYLTEPCSNYLRQAVETVLEIHKKEGPGDILLFLTGQEEVESAIQMIQVEESAMAAGSISGLYVLALFAGLPRSDQDLVFAPSPRGRRKVVVSTNIAETSITIDGIVYVVDSGFSKQKFYNPVTDMESLVVAPISRASALQRAGRAGRLRPGKCFRLYTEETYLNDLASCAIPEIQRTNLAPIVLQLKSLGIDNIMRFDWLDPPSPEAMIRALELLYALKALDSDARLVKPTGMHLAELPLEPMLGAMLLSSSDIGCSREVLTIVACASVQSVWVGTSNLKDLDEAKSRFAAAEGDFVTYLNVYLAFLRSGKSGKWCNNNFVNYRAMMRVTEIRSQLERQMQRLGRELNSCDRDVGLIRRAITSGYFPNVAQLQPYGDGTTYKIIRTGHLAKIHPSSVLFRASPKWILFQSSSVSSTETYMQEVCTIDPNWLTDIAPHFYRKELSR